MRIFTLVIAFLTVSIVSCQVRPECSAWSEIEDRIKLQSDHLSCIKNNMCTGMNCTGSFQGEEFHAGVQIHQCENPSFIAAFIDIPQFGIHNWQRSFTHGSTFDLSETIKGEVSLQKEKDKFIIGLNMKVLTGIQNYFPKLAGGLPSKFPILNGTAFPVPPCESAVHPVVTEPGVNEITIPSATHEEIIPSSGMESNVKIYGNCTINNSSCQRNETCMQLDKFSPDGICICRPSYTRYKTGQCIFTPESVPTAESDIPIPESKAEDKSGISMSVLRTAILVSVTAILFIIGIAYIGIRFKVFQYLRRKFRVQVYEHVLLGQEEDNDEPLTDPVA